MTVHSWGAISRHSLCQLFHHRHAQLQQPPGADLHADEQGWRSCTTTWMRQGVMEPVVAGAQKQESRGQEEECAISQTPFSRVQQPFGSGCGSTQGSHTNTLRPR